MTALEDRLSQNAEQIGQVWVHPVSLKELIEQNRVRVSGTDNAFLVEIDGETWTIPEAFRLVHFPD